MLVFDLEVNNKLEMEGFQLRRLQVSTTYIVCIFYRHKKNSDYNFFEFCAKMKEVLIEHGQSLSHKEWDWYTIRPTKNSAFFHILAFERTRKVSTL